MAAHAQLSMMQAAFVPPRPAFLPQQQQQQHRLGSSGAIPENNTLAAAAAAGGGGTSSIEFSDEAVRENFLLRQQLAARDATIDSLQHQVENLEQEIRQLRQLPTGKISQIPLEYVLVGTFVFLAAAVFIDRFVKRKSSLISPLPYQPFSYRDMLSIMREFGSELSDTAMPPRKSYVQKASAVRQFRRWNPNFLDWFEHVNGKWVPKLGKAGELKRRQEARRTASTQRKKKGGGGGSSLSRDCEDEDEEDQSMTLKTEI